MVEARATHTAGEFRRIGGRGVMTVPTECTVELTGDDLPLDVELTAALGDDDRFHIAAVTFRQRDEPVTGAAIRALPLARLLPYAMRVAVAPFALSDEPGPEDAADGPTDEALRKVASVYMLSYVLGESPTRQVAETFGLARPTAGRWVGKARQRGLLGDTDERKAGV